MNLPAPLALSPDWIAMMDKGVSAIVSSCSLDMRPSIMRAVGMAIAAGGRSVTLYMARPQSRQLLQDIASTGRLAMVFSKPATHRTLQLKAVGVRIRCADATDEPALARYLASMETEIEEVGYAPAFARAMLAASFAPQQNSLTVLRSIAP